MIGPPKVPLPNQRSLEPQNDLIHRQQFALAGYNRTYVLPAGTTDGHLLDAEDFERLGAGGHGSEVIGADRTRAGSRPTLRTRWLSVARPSPHLLSSVRGAVRSD